MSGNRTTIRCQTKSSRKKTTPVALTPTEADATIPSAGYPSKAEALPGKTTASGSPDTTSTSGTPTDSVPTPSEPVASPKTPADTGTSVSTYKSSHSPTLTANLSASIVGLKQAAVASNGLRCDSGWYRRLEQKTFAAAQRARHERRVKRLHAKVKNCRKDAQHKFSTAVVRAASVPSTSAMYPSNC